LEQLGKLFGEVVDLDVIEWRRLDGNLLWRMAQTSGADVKQCDALLIVAFALVESFNAAGISHTVSTADRLRLMDMAQSDIVKIPGQAIRLKDHIFVFGDAKQLPHQRPID